MASTRPHGGCCACASVEKMEMDLERLTCGSTASKSWNDITKAFRRINDQVKAQWANLTSCGTLCIGNGRRPFQSSGPLNGATLPSETQVSKSWECSGLLHSFLMFAAVCLLHFVCAWQQESFAHRSLLSRTWTWTRKKSNSWPAEQMRQFMSFIFSVLPTKTNESCTFCNFWNPTKNSCWRTNASGWNKTATCWDYALTVVLREADNPVTLMSIAANMSNVPTVIKNDPTLSFGKFHKL